MKYLVQHFIERTLQEIPTRTAIKQGDRLFSYGEVDQLSRKFQTYYRENPPRGDMIGILSRVRAEAVVAMIGALREGVVYVPLNIMAPVAWLGNVIKNAGLETLLVDSLFLPLAEQLKEFGVKNIFCLDASGVDLPSGMDGFSNVLELEPCTTSPTKAILADDLAWVLYTSGSTGSPKGIMITHRNAFTFIDWMAEEFNLTDKDRIFN
ncbi:MAG: acyl--CoA ligase, partial [Cyanobacteria bacterium]|nr:acyl--CoA ligase [Cyanobacteriota bacterium]